MVGVEASRASFGPAAIDTVPTLSLMFIVAEALRPEPVEPVRMTSCELSSTTVTVWVPAVPGVSGWTSISAESCPAGMVTEPASAW